MSVTFIHQAEEASGAAPDGTAPSVPGGRALLLWHLALPGCDNLHWRPLRFPLLCHFQECLLHIRLVLCMMMTSTVTLVYDDDEKAMRKMGQKKLDMEVELKAA